jgi:hypothetical protein
MTFNEELFDKTRKAIPNITTRSISRYMGKSEGYFSSMTAQDLTITTEALISFASILDCYKSDRPNKALTELISFVENEIAHRMTLIDMPNYRVRKSILDAVAKINYNAAPLGPLPILIGFWEMLIKEKDTADQLRIASLKKTMDNAKKSLAAERQRQRVVRAQKTLKKALNASR